MELTQAFLDVKATLTHHLTISVKNLVAQTNTNMENLSLILNTLQSDGIIRLASSKSCSGTCTSCPSCFESANKTFTGDEIVISMISSSENDLIFD